MLVPQLLASPHGITPTLLWWVQAPREPQLTLEKNCRCPAHRKWRDILQRKWRRRNLTPRDPGRDWKRLGCPPLHRPCKHQRIPSLKSHGTYHAWISSVQPEAGSAPLQPRAHAFRPHTPPTHPRSAPYPVLPLLATQSTTGASGSPTGAPRKRDVMASTSPWSTPSKRVPTGIGRGVVAARWPVILSSRAPRNVQQWESPRETQALKES
mmetsp:Transcript_9530/g.26639  ORF Transcript_9530/g.26639 Transcript_9530/m.26639 type:complete len:210 (-) Transcript_9530:1140-1769(-)